MAYSTVYVRVCCHTNEICVPIAKPPNSAQQGGTPYHSPVLHLGVCSGVGMWHGTDRYTDGCGKYTVRLGHASHEM